MSAFDEVESQRRGEILEQGAAPAPALHRLLLASTETRLDGSSFHTKLEFRFEARDAKALMTMTQRGFPTAELREEHERGVPNAFARLDRLIQLRWRSASALKAPLSESDEPSGGG
jgi:hypothetical protein